jgi:small-conductance mechanosensitive channel
LDFNKYYKFVSKPYIPALVVSVVLFITVFLPWATVSALGISFSANGMNNWGVLTFIMSLVGVGLSFNAIQKMRTLGLIGAGILALIGVILYWTTYLQGANIGFGLIIALLASLAVMYIGYRDYRKLSPPAKPTPPTPPTPPAPPPQQ